MKVVKEADGRRDIYSLSWERQKELEAIRIETRRQATEAVAKAKKLGWKPKAGKQAG